MSSMGWVYNVVQAEVDTKLVIIRFIPLPEYGANCLAFFYFSQDSMMTLTVSATQAILGGNVELFYFTVDELYVQNGK